MLRPQPLGARVRMQVSAVSCTYQECCSSPTQMALQGEGYIFAGSTETQTKQLGHNTPDPYSNQREHEDGGFAVQPPSETVPELTFAGGQVDESACYLIQSGRSRGRSWCS